MEQAFQSIITCMIILRLLLNNDKNVFSLYEPISFFPKKLSAHPFLVVSEHCISDLSSNGQAKPNVIKIVGCNNYGILCRIIPLATLQ